MKLVVSSSVGKSIVCPDALQTFDELSAAAVALVMVEPMLSYTGELLPNQYDALLIQEKGQDGL